MIKFKISMEEIVETSIHISHAKLAKLENVDTDDLSSLHIAYVVDASSFTTEVQKVYKTKAGVLEWKEGSFESCRIKASLSEFRESGLTIQLMSKTGMFSTKDKKQALGGMPLESLMPKEGGKGTNFEVMLHGAPFGTNAIAKITGVIHINNVVNYVQMSEGVNTDAAILAGCYDSYVSGRMRHIINTPTKEVKYKTENGPVRSTSYKAMVIPVEVLSLPPAPMLPPTSPITTTTSSHHHPSFAQPYPHHTSISRSPSLDDILYKIPIFDFKSLASLETFTGVDITLTNEMFRSANTGDLLVFHFDTDTENEVLAIAKRKIFVGVLKSSVNHVCMIVRVREKLFLAEMVPNSHEIDLDVIDPSKVRGTILSLSFSISLYISPSFFLSRFLFLFFPLSRTHIYTLSLIQTLSLSLS